MENKLEEKKPEEKKGFFRPRFFIIMLVAVVFAQFFSMNYLTKELSVHKLEYEKKLSECYETMNTMSIMQGSLVNILVEKNIVDRNKLLEEAQKMSVDIKNMLDRMNKYQDNEVKKGDPGTELPSIN